MADDRIFFTDMTGARFAGMYEEEKEMILYKRSVDPVPISHPLRILRLHVGYINSFLIYIRNYGNNYNIISGILISHDDLNCIARKVRIELIKYLVYAIKLIEDNASYFNHSKNFDQIRSFKEHLKDVCNFREFASHKLPDDLKMKAEKILNQLHR